MGVTSAPASADDGVRVTKTTAATSDCAFAVYTPDNRYCFNDPGSYDIGPITGVSRVCVTSGWAVYAWAPNPGERHNSKLQRQSDPCDDYSQVPGNTVVDWVELHP
ncbi:hypothetical protein GCM10010211_71620 [Streptomyces albospinus]|uniref:Secreted protein n=1 Tax=Streptomyces albospinus TaxID=285515 RepID=A0ABQ2VN47_9ACTN|nr:hypothetical protein [Streptomyces albospinus]GGU94235.1 hypothetical protein GCM10010211_71620 [Streptomyces albospinus]